MQLDDVEADARRAPRRRGESFAHPHMSRRHLARTYASPVRKAGPTAPRSPRGSPWVSVTGAAAQGLCDDASRAGMGKLDAECSVADPPREIDDAPQRRLHSSE